MTKVKLGVWLACRPNSGGMFQYNLSVLGALQKIQSSEFEIVAAYLDDLWRPILASFCIRGIPFRRTLLSKIFYRYFRFIPVLTQQKLGTKFFSDVSKIDAEACDLWLFPSQDIFSFLLPVDSLVAVHDLMHRYERRFPEVGSPREYLSREYLYSNIVRFSKGVLVDSRIGKVHVTESYGTDPNKVFTLPYAPPPSFVGGEGERTEDLSILKKIPKKFLFYPAQFWEHKNHFRLVQAIHAVKAMHPDIALVLSGSPKNAYEKIKMEVERLELTSQVIFLGYIEEFELKAIYRRARALVMPTFFGPTNIPPLEAFSMNCPVAVSGIYGMPEQLGDAALYFRPESVEELTRTIERLWTDDVLCKELIEKGSRRLNELSQDQFNRRLFDIISSLVLTR